MTNIVLQFGGIIPTNTPAIKEYALSVLIAQATFFSEQWNLDVRPPITTNQITGFSVAATTNGVRSGIQLNNRYAVSIDDAKLMSFTDMHFDDRSFIDNDEKIEALLKKPDLLTLETAVALARDKLKKIGIDENEHGLGKPVKSWQWKYDWDGVFHPLPLYEVHWRSDEGVVRMQISGVTSNVARFFQITRAPSLRVPRPPNYLEMLGLPEDTVFLPHDYEIRQRIEALRESGHETEPLQRPPPPVRLKPGDSKRER
jgi:hypothetical protein